MTESRVAPPAERCPNCVVRPRQRPERIRRGEEVNPRVCAGVVVVPPVARTHLEPWAVESLSANLHRHVLKDIYDKSCD